MLGFHIIPLLSHLCFLHVTLKEFVNHLSHDRRDLRQHRDREAKQRMMGGNTGRGAGVC